MIRHIYKSQNDYHHSISYYYISSHNYQFFFYAEKFKIYSLSNIQVYDTVLLAIISMLCIWCPNL